MNPSDNPENAEFLQHIKKPLLISIPHSGEQVPPEAKWLNGLPETLLMYDVDRYVDRLYAPVIQTLKIPSIQTKWHRYAIDLNRLPDDVDADSVIGHNNPSGKFPRGLHWAITTKKEKLMPEPITRELHEELVRRYFNPFHDQVRKTFEAIKEKGAPVTYHIDAHSMPSLGTSEHNDPGEKRADVVISDCRGKSCSPWFRDLVLASYKNAGFSVAHNWPYFGGRVTETYGQPALNQESIQVELNRGLYMDETSKRWIDGKAQRVSDRINQAIQEVYAALPILKI